MGGLELLVEEDGRVINSRFKRVHLPDLKDKRPSEIHWDLYRNPVLVKKHQKLFLRITALENQPDQVFNVAWGEKEERLYCRLYEVMRRSHDLSAAEHSL